VQSIEFNCWELFGQLFRLPLPIFFFRFAPQKGFPLKSDCEWFNTKKRRKQIYYGRRRL